MHYLAREILRILIENEGRYVSGSDMAKRLGISRSSVNRYIDVLRSLGFVIDTHPRYGYRLVVESDLRRAHEYIESLNTSLKYRVQYIERCCSTQDIAEILAKEGAPEGTLVIAEEMYCGRGRLGRKWYASRGGLWFTLILRLPRVERLHLLSLIAGIAVVEAIRELLALDVGLKWPNDVVYQDRKLCGILIEARAEADIINYVLLGVGVNVNNDIPEDLRDRAIALKEIIGYDIPRIPILRSILVRFDTLYTKLKEERYTEIISLWKRYSATLGRAVEVITIDGTKIRGYAKDIDLDGALLIESNGKLVRIEAGDVFHLR